MTDEGLKPDKTGKDLNESSAFITANPENVFSSDANTDCTADDNVLSLLEEAKKIDTMIVSIAGIDDDVALVADHSDSISTCSTIQQDNRMKTRSLFSFNADNTVDLSQCIFRSKKKQVEKRRYWVLSILILVAILVVIACSVLITISQEQADQQGEDNLMDDVRASLEDKNKYNSTSENFSDFDTKDGYTLPQDPKKNQVNNGENDMDLSTDPEQLSTNIKHEDKPGKHNVSEGNDELGTEYDTSQPAMGHNSSFSGSYVDNSDPDLIKFTSAPASPTPNSRSPTSRSPTSPSPTSPSSTSPLPPATPSLAFVPFSTTSTTLNDSNYFEEMAASTSYSLLEKLKTGSNNCSKSDEIFEILYDASKNASSWHIQQNAQLLYQESSIQYFAYCWMFSNDRISSSYSQSLESSTSTAENRNLKMKLIQRYSVVVMALSLNADYNIVSPITDVCDWSGITCGAIVTSSNITSDQHALITEIQWFLFSLNGTIPSEVGLLSESLRLLDLSENSITGSIPDGLYDLINLEYLYLQRNQISGILSPRIGNLYNFVKLFLSENQISGFIPPELGSFLKDSNGIVIRPLEWLTLYKNQLSGPIPQNLKLRKLFYLDFGYNNLNGTIPTDWVDSFGKLRMLYLNDNQLSGELPSAWPYLGDSRMQTINLANNMLSGEYPTTSAYETVDFMNILEIQHNQFTYMSNDICHLSIFEKGELISMNADCDICSCKELCKVRNCNEKDGPH